MRVFLILLGFLAPLALASTFTGEMNDCDCECTCPDTTCEPTVVTITCIPQSGSVCDNFITAESSFSQVCAPCMGDKMTNNMYEDCLAKEGDADELAEFLANIAALCHDQTGAMPEFPEDDIECPTDAPPTDAPTECTTTATCDVITSYNDALAMCDFSENLDMWSEECDASLESDGWQIILFELVDISGWLVDIVIGLLEWLKTLMLILRSVIECILDNTCPDSTSLIDLLEEILALIDLICECIENLIVDLNNISESADETLQEIENFLDCTTTTTEPILVECPCTCWCPPEEPPPCTTTTEEPTTTPTTEEVITTTTTEEVITTTTTPTTTTTTSTTTTCIPVTECDSFTDTDSQFSQQCAPCMGPTLVNSMILDCADFAAMSAADLAAFIANIQALCKDQTGQLPEFPTIPC